MSARRLTAGCLVWLCMVASVILLGGSSALAERGHVFGGTFGEPCTREPCGRGQFKEPGQVAVNEASGDVYVIDSGDKRVEWFSASGAYLGQFDGSGSFEVATKVEVGTAAGGGGNTGEIPTGKFTRPLGIAIDNACALHSPALTEATSPTCHEFDPSAGDIYLYDDAGSGNEVIDKFTVTGEYVGQLTRTPSTSFKQVVGVSVDSKGVVWIYRNSEDFSGTIYSFSSASPNAFLSERSVREGSADEGSGSFAVDFDKNADYYYLFSRNGGSARRYTSLGEGIELGNGKSSLEESVEPLVEQILENDPVYAVAVDPVTHEFYTSSQEQFVTRFTENLSQVEQFGEGHVNGGAGSGIGVDSPSEEVYVADSVADVVNMFLPEPPSAPKITEQTVSFVTSDSATFSGSINPEGFATEYHFEYGPTTSYGQSASVADAMAGAGFELDEVASHVQGLVAGLVYHYRMVAHNSDGTTYGEDQTFTTQASGSALGLADGRTYELVTPPAKNGALFLGLNAAYGSGVSAALGGQASTDGRAIENLASNPTEAEPQGNAMEVAVLSTRGSTEWSSQVIAPAHTEATFISIGFGGEYRFFSEDLSRGIVSPFGSFSSLAPDATESTPYVRTDFLNDDPEEHCHTDCFQPLVTAANTQPGSEFGEALPNGVCPNIICGPYFIDATPDLSHVILDSPAQLTSVPTPEGGLYEWAGGQLQLISSPPKGQTGVLRLAGALTGIGIGGTSGFLANGEYEARHAMSDDGTRVILVGNGLYLRDLTTGELIRLDATQGGSANSLEPAYMTASTDASRIFFLDNAGLTPESSVKGTDLYEYDLNAPVGRRLTDLTVDEHAGEAANVTSVIGASNDGAYIYFVAGGALASGADEGECQLGEGLRERREACDIYMRHNGVTRLVASDWNPSRSGEESVRVSPDGSWLAFMSNRSLTGYDTRDAISGHPDVEVYLYGASAAKLTCASCNSTGARPVGIELGNPPKYLAGGSLVNKWAAANVPPWTRMEAAESRHQPRYLSDAGRLFFDSNDALVPQDVNGTEDVYEYEPAGVGSCTTSSATFGQQSNGCVNLVSSGSSAEESAFVDASETGGDAFFITSSKLVSQDFDNARDVYDAHECSASEPCYPATPTVPPVCSTGDACKAAPKPQPAIFGPAPSATFTGAGNVISSSPGGSGVKSKSLTRAQKLEQALRECRRKGRGRRAVCERNARRRFGRIGKSKASAKRKGRG